MFWLNINQTESGRYLVSFDPAEGGDGRSSLDVMGADEVKEILMTLALTDGEVEAAMKAGLHSFLIPAPHRTT